ncbi:MAG: hypothetical protein F6K10_08980 [Moorea sp. SIO2B7]|nr:hypothetical protein [Moorena sp. SIO2B7]
MISKSISIVFTAAAIALSGTTFATKVSFSQENATPRMTFVCAKEANPPTTFVYTEGQVNLERLFHWEDEYLLPSDSAEELCERVAQKLQNRYDQGQKILFAFNKQEDRVKVCLVSSESEQCNSNNSEELFSSALEPQSPYKYPDCIMDYKFDKCNRSRAAISIPQGAYKPIWWPF